MSNPEVGIFALRRQDRQTNIRVHQFGDLEQLAGLESSIDLLVWRGHVRFSMPPTDAELTSWRDWEQQVGGSFYMIGPRETLYCAMALTHRKI